MLQIHEKIKLARESARLSQDEMAEKLQMKRSTYQYWEEKDPSVLKIARVAEALGLDKGVFFVQNDEDFYKAIKFDAKKKGDQQQEISKDRLLDIIQEQMAWLRSRVDSDLDVLVSGISSISTRQSVDREVVFQALSKLTGLDPNALLKEADKKMSGEQEKDAQPGKSRANGKNGKKLA